MGISVEGMGAEQRFRELTGAVRSNKSADGDASIRVDGVDYEVEVKKCGSGTVNQVRAIKFITLVVWHQPTDRWYVLPPQEIVRLVYRKPRGQHSELALECATLRFPADFPGEGLRGEKLKGAVETACRSRGKYDKLHAAMNDILGKIQRLRQLVETQVGPLLP